MRWITLLGVIVGSMIVVVTGCTGSSSQEEKPYAPHINPADFTTAIDNKFFPLKPGTTFFYKGKSQDATKRDEMVVTHDTKRIMGVECVVVSDKATENGELVEQTLDWFAQDKEGNVWYFGEDSKESENGKVTSTEGSWEAGKDGAKPGIIMQAHPEVGQPYRQEYYKGVAEDMAQVLSFNESASVPYGSFDHLLVTRDWNPLEPGQEVVRKYYAAGVGKIMEVPARGLPEPIELVDVKSTG